MSFEHFAPGRVLPGNSEVLGVSYGDDNGLYVEFYLRDVLNQKKTDEAGRQIFESREYVKIMPIGDKTKTIDRPVRKMPSATVPADTVRFPRQWQAFLNQETQVTEGTPVTEWAAISRADAMSLKALNIYTVEMLAQLQDNHLTWLGARSFRDKAKIWLENAKEGAAASKWAKEKADMQAQIDALRNSVEGFRSAGVPIAEVKLQEAYAPPAPKKRGRKPKVKNEQNIPSVNAASG